MHVLKKIGIVTTRRYATKIKISVELEDTIDAGVNNGKINPKRHPGIITSRNVSLPARITDAIKCALGDTPIKSVVRDSVELFNYLRSRHPPTEERHIKQKKLEITNLLDETEPVDLTEKSQEDIDKLKAKREKKITKILNEKIYTWKAIPYEKYACLKYLVSRAAPEYAVLHRIFTEIKNREVDYKPTSLFDFGSGVGTGTWVTQMFWKDSLQEVFTVDTSGEMNNLARLILCDGQEDGEIPINKFYQRQFLPATPTPYDIVLCAYTLFELPSAQNRLLTILNLWRKTEDFLIIVEQGTNAGYSLINEARDFILDCKEDHLVGHVYSPCPHDALCPRFFQDRTPCNFPMTFQKLKLTEKNEPDNELFSYVVLRKGKRSEDGKSWPRVVRPALIRSKHVVCRMCCEDGKLNEVIFTAKRHGKSTYKCAKNTKWGDRIPISMSMTEVETLDKPKSNEGSSPDGDNSSNHKEGSAEDETAPMKT